MRSSRASSHAGQQIKTVTRAEARDDISAGVNPTVSAGAGSPNDAHPGNIAQRIKRQISTRRGDVYSGRSEIGIKGG